VPHRHKNAAGDGVNAHIAPFALSDFQISSFSDWTTKELGKAGTFDTNFTNAAN
jgi:hypothetical protein